MGEALREWAAAENARCHGKWMGNKMDVCVGKMEDREVCVGRS
jgi:hypothetical protein